jgi:hypothetical protein
MSSVATAGLRLAFGEKKGGVELCYVLFLYFEGWHCGWIFNNKIFTYLIQTQAFMSPTPPPPTKNPTKADLHVACRAAKGLKCLSHLIYTVRPCLIHTCHAAPMLFFWRPRHSTPVERRPVGYLPAFGFFWLPRGVPQRLLSEAYQSSSQRSIPPTERVVATQYKKGRSVKLLV